MSAARLEAIRDLIQVDVGRRGLRTDPSANLVTATAPDFAAACRSVAAASNPAVAIVTGFFISHAQPPCGETDGPLGALFLARALVPLGIRVVVATDDFCLPALGEGLKACGLENAVRLVRLPGEPEARSLSAETYWKDFVQAAGSVTHLVALERVGPSHTLASLQAQGATADDLALFQTSVLPTQHDRCFSMRGVDISAAMSPAHQLFEAGPRLHPELTTIGIGDGGNEIGMGKLSWALVRKNIVRGALIACRVATEHLIVCGISNWGAYGLAAGVRWLRGVRLDDDLYNLERERQLLELMVERGPLVDGVSARQIAAVDGLPFDRYAEPLQRLGEQRMSANRGISGGDLANTLGE